MYKNVIDTPYHIFIACASIAISSIYRLFRAATITHKFNTYFLCIHLMCLTPFESPSEVSMGPS